jgi:hypothetical protein
VCGRILSPHDVLKIQGDGPRDPGHEDAVAASPRRVAGTGRSVGEDVAVEDVAAKNEEKLVPPLSVGGRGGVEEDGDQVLDVRDPGGLKVEVGDHGVILATRGSSTRRRQRSGRELRRRGDTLPRRGVKRSTSTTWRARTSAVESSCSQARAATHTHTPRRRLSRSWRSLGPQQGRCWWRPRWWDAVTCLGGRRWQRRGWPWAACEAAEQGENADGWTARGERDAERQSTTPERNRGVRARARVVPQDSEGGCHDVGSSRGYGSHRGRREARDGGQGQKVCGCHRGSSCRAQV